ncbi:zinc finger, CCHC-type containing protein [Tanacetum coccineum]
MKYMASNFAKLDKFEGVDFRIWQKKMHFLLSSMSVVYVLTTHMPEDGGDNLTVEQVRKRAKWDNDNYVCRGLILNGIFQDTLKHKKKELTLVELGSHLRIGESLEVQESDRQKATMLLVLQLSIWWSITTPLCTMTTRVNVNIMITQGLILTRRQNLLVRNVAKLVTLKGIAKVLMLATKPMVQSQRVQWMDDDVAWSVNSRATVHLCKDRCWFKTYKSLNDRSILHMGNESTSLVHGRGCVDLRFSSRKIVLLFNVLHVPNIRKNLVSTSILNNCGYKQVTESSKFVLSKHGMFIGFGYLSNQMFRLNIVNDNIASAFMSTSKLNDSILWHARLGHVHFKMMQDMSKDGLISAFDMDTEKCKTCMLTKITKKLFQNVKRETKVLELIHSDLCDLHATPSLWNKKYFVICIDDASMFCYVYLLHSKDEALDKFKSVGIIHESTAPYTPQQNGISERKNRILKEMVNSMLSYSGLSQGFWGEAMEVVRLPEPKLKTLGERGIECIFVGYVEHSKAFSFIVIEPNNSVSINSIIESRDSIFDENRFSSILRPNLRIPIGTEDFGGSVVLEEVTEEVVQQPKPKLRKSKRNRTPKDFRPEFQLYLIKGTMDEVSDQHSYCFNVDDDPKTFDEAMKSQDIAFWKEAINDEMDSIMATTLGQKSEIYYFDTYAPVARISTIKLLIAMTSIYNLIIYQMDVKTAFLNGKLEDEHAPKQWHQKFDEVVLSNGYLLNQADKCVYSKFDETGKGVIICLYVVDMLIFGTNQVQVDLAKEFLSSRFLMKDMDEADVILVSTLMDTSEKLMPNNGQAVSQLEYYRVIGCLMYAMTCTRPDIAFVVGKLSRYTSNPGTQHWQAIQRVLKYLKKTIDYRLAYTGYSSVLEGYTDASWIRNTKDNSSTSGWVFLLGGDAIFWASMKKLALLIPLWSKPISPISIRYDSAATLAKAYSQMYNGKSRHLGVRHSMICKLITNGVVSIEFVRSQLSTRLS